MAVQPATQQLPALMLRMGILSMHLVYKTQLLLAVCAAGPVCPCLQSCSLLALGAMSRVIRGHLSQQQ